MDKDDKVLIRVNNTDDTIMCFISTFYITIKVQNMSSILMRSRTMHSSTYRSQSFTVKFL